MEQQMRYQETEERQSSYQPMKQYTHPAKKHRAMGEVVFLLLGLPLGICYFTIAVVGLSVGLGTLVIWIGVPILFVTLLVVRGMAEIELRLVNNLLGIPLAYQLPGRREPGLNFLQRFGRILTDPYTWTSMVYMLIKLPLGILGFTLTISLAVTTLVLTLSPLGYLINMLVIYILSTNGIVTDGVVIPGFLIVHGYFEPVMFARSFLAVPIGIGFWLATRYVLSILALASGELARALLGPGTAYVSAQPHTSYAPPMPEQEPRAYREQRTYAE